MILFFRECSTASVSLAEVLHPDGKIIPTLLQFVWTLWEDPVNVSWFAL